jgi:hypothetical protein
LSLPYRLLRLPEEPNPGAVRDLLTEIIFCV